MTINEMRAKRKERGLLTVDNSTKSKIEKPQEGQSLEEKENNSKNIQIKFIKKINYNFK